MTSGAPYNIRQSGNVQIIEFTRQAHDLISLKPSRQILSGLITSTGQPRCLLDLHNVEWGGSTFLAVIMEFNLQILRKHGQLRLCGLQPHMKEIFNRTRIGTILSIHETCEDALKSFA